VLDDLTPLLLRLVVVIVLAGAWTRSDVDSEEDLPRGLADARQNGGGAFESEHLAPGGNRLRRSTTSFEGAHRRDLTGSPGKGQKAAPRCAERGGRVMIIARDLEQRRGC